MKEFKFIFLSQILIINLLFGICLGNLTGYPIYHTKIIKVMPEQIYPEYIMKQALRHNGVLWAYKDGKNWLFINKKGISCKLFKGVK